MFLPLLVSPFNPSNTTNSYPVDFYDQQPKLRKMSYTKMSRHSKTTLAVCVPYFNLLLWCWLRLLGIRRNSGLPG